MNKYIKLSRIFALLFILCFGAVGQSHAGLLKQAAKHPVLTLGVVGAGAAMMAHSNKIRCGKSSDGIGVH